MDTSPSRVLRAIRAACLLVASAGVSPLAAAAASPSSSSSGASSFRPSSDDMLAYVHAGTAFPVHPGEFDQFWHIGWNAGAGLGVPVSPLWELAIQFDYQHHLANEARQANDLLLSGPGGVTVPVAHIDGRDLTVLTLMAEARFLVPSARPSRTWFLAFGFGVGEESTSDATVTSTDPTMDPIMIVGDSDVAFASSMGGGFEIDLSPHYRLTVDSIYTIVFTEGTSTQYLPLRLGLARRFR